MRVAVTGAAGFIGSHLVERLVLLNHDVLALDDLSTGSLDNLRAVRGSFEFAPLDVRNRIACWKAIDRFSPAAVAHLAAVASVVRSIEEPEYAHAVNLDGTFNVLEAARIAGVHRLVFASSAAVYGLEPALPSLESDPVAPLSPYAAQKAAGELLARVYREVWGIETVALRFFNVFGERQRPDSPYSGVISLFAEALSTRGWATILGDGQQTRDFIYVGDVVSAVAAALVGPDPGAGPYNVGRGEEITIRRLYRLVAQTLGAPDDPRYGPARPGDVRHSRASTDALHHRLGVTPEVEVEEGLARLVRWRGGLVLR